MNKTIGTIIESKARKFSVDRGTSVRKTVEYMHENNRAAVAVRDGEEVVGVFSERDLLRRVVRKRLDLDTVAVGEVMSAPPHCISIEETCQDAKAAMIKHDVHHLVVLDRGRHFVGFVSTRDLLEADLSDSRELVQTLNDSYYEPRAQS